MSAGSISPADLAEALHAGLCDAAQARDQEQAVIGLDGEDELALHPLLADALHAAEYGAHREVHYPGVRDRGSARDGERCDLVLTTEGRPLRPRADRATLFDDPDAVEPEHAFWLEVKVVAQFRASGPNRQYSSQLLSVVSSDLRKLGSDPAIRAAALAVILFTREEAVAIHDLAVWQQRCLEKGHALGVPSVRGFPITDRIGTGQIATAHHPLPIRSVIGNGWCAASVATPCGRISGLPHHE